MFVDIVTAPGVPARATIRASSASFFALRTSHAIPVRCLAHQRKDFDSKVVDRRCGQRVLAKLAGTSTELRVGQRTSPVAESIDFSKRGIVAAQVNLHRAALKPAETLPPVHKALPRQGTALPDTPTQKPRGLRERGCGRCARGKKREERVRLFVTPRNNVRNRTRREIRKQNPRRLEYRVVDAGHAWQERRQRDSHDADEDNRTMRPRHG